MHAEVVGLQTPTQRMPAWTLRSKHVVSMAAGIRSSSFWSRASSRQALSHCKRLLTTYMCCPPVYLQTNAHGIGRVHRVPFRRLFCWAVGAAIVRSSRYSVSPANLLSSVSWKYPSDPVLTDAACVVTSIMSPNNMAQHTICLTLSSNHRHTAIQRCKRCVCQKANKRDKMQTD